MRLLSPIMLIQDSAFVDRADIKEYVGLPPPQAIYWILSSCLQQLQAGNLVKHASLPLWGTACAQAGNEANSSNPGPRLIALATACHVSQDQRERL